MVSSSDKSTRRALEVLNALQRCFLAGDSPGVKLAAGFAVELMTGMGICGRPLPLRSVRDLNFAVSVTLLSASMDEVLLKRGKQRQRLPRTVLDEQVGSIPEIAYLLSCTASGDTSVELALLGRPLAVELWDDQDDVITIGLNYLAISRASNLEDHNPEWEFTQFKQLNLQRMDQRECLVLSEMLSTMGVSNPYDIENEDDHKPLNLTSAA